MFQEEILLLGQEIQALFRNGAIKRTTSKPKSENQCLSSFFLASMKDAGYHLIMNLKRLNQHIPYLHFKMVGLFLKEGFYRCIIFSPSTSGFPSIFENKVQGQSISIRLTVWVRPSIQGSHNVKINSHLTVKETEGLMSNNISRQYFDNGILNEGIDIGKG